MNPTWREIAGLSLVFKLRMSTHLRKGKEQSVRANPLSLHAQAPPIF
jgi:hypothetical protein